MAMQKPELLPEDVCPCLSTKTMVLNTTVLVAVIAFGAALTPLAQNLIGGGALLKYVLVASVRGR